MIATFTTDEMVRMGETHLRILSLISARHTRDEAPAIIIAMLMVSFASAVEDMGVSYEAGISELTEVSLLLRSIREQHTNPQPSN